MKESYIDFYVRVLQGSVLGPLLLLSYGNILPSSILNRYKIFADDLKIYLNIDPFSPLPLAQGTSCQGDVGTIYLITSSWGLDLKRDKCAVLRSQWGSVAWNTIGTMSKERKVKKFTGLVCLQSNLSLSFIPQVCFFPTAMPEKQGQLTR